MNYIGQITLSIHAPAPGMERQSFCRNGLRSITSYPARVFIGEHIEAGGAGGSILLPPSLTLRRGAEIEIRSMTAETLTVSAFDGATINGEMANEITTRYEVKIYFWTGAGWGIR